MGLEQRAGQPRKEPKPYNSLGIWVSSYAREKGTSVEALKREFGIPGLRTPLHRSETSISMFTIERVLQGAEKTDASEEQMDKLRDVVAGIIEKTIAEKKGLYTRTPPAIPRTVSKGLDCVTYTAASLARALSPGTDGPRTHVLATFIKHCRSKMGYSPVMTVEQAGEITKMWDEHELRAGKIKSDFGRTLVE